MHIFFSAPSATKPRPGILLDRDGVINQRVWGGYVTEWDHFQFVPEMKRAVAGLSRLGLPVVVVSNQACVGKGFIEERVLRDITHRFVGALREEGGRIDAVYYCPHTPTDDCQCRKPRPGLLEQAAKDWALDLSRSVLIGDSPTDAEAARAVNCRALLFGGASDKAAADPSLQPITVRDPSQLPGRVCELLQLPSFAMPGSA